MRGMWEIEMKKVAAWMKRVADEIKDYEYVEDKEQRNKKLTEFREFIHNNAELIKIRAEVKEMCLKFPIYKQNI